jgi:hypothetical protein
MPIFVNADVHHYGIGNTLLRRSTTPSWVFAKEVRIHCKFSIQYVLDVHLHTTGFPASRRMLIVDWVQEGWMAG